MNLEVRRETHPYEVTPPIHARVQGPGRPGGLDRSPVAGRGVPPARPQPQPADHLEDDLPGVERAHTPFQGDERHDEDQARIAELEQLLGRATRQIEVLKKASTRLGAAAIRNGR